MNPPIRILLIDDSPYFLDAASDFLRYQESVTVVGAITEGKEALAQSQKLEPDIILLDLNLANSSGLELIPHFKKNLPATRVIALTMMEESSYRAAAIQAGADGFVHKSSMSKILLSTILDTVGQAQVIADTTTPGHGGIELTRLAEHLPDLIYRYELRPKRGFTYVSPSAASMTGYTPDDHYADPDLGFKLVHPADRPLLEAAAQGGCDSAQPLVIRWIRQDGQVIWIEQRNVNIFDDAGDLVAMEGIARDITKQKQAEDALLESEASLRESQSIAHIGHWSWYTKENIVEWSDEMKRIFGLDPKTFGGKLAEIIEMAIHPEDREKLQAANQAVLTEQKPAPLEYRIVLPDQSVRTVLAIPGNKVVDEEGKILKLTGIVQDVTERKHLQQTHDQLFKYALDLLCIAGFDGYFKEINPAWENALGWTPAELKSKPFLEFVHPDDRAATSAAVDTLVHGNFVFQFENRYLCKDGSYKWISWNFQSVPQEGLIYAVARDVTGQKQAEEILQESEDKFRHVFDHSVIGKSITLLSGEMHANRAFCEMLGYTYEEMQSKKWQEVTLADDLVISEGIVASILAGEVDSARFLKRYLHKNGSVIWADVSTSLRRDKCGTPLYFISVISDITDRRQAEEALRKSEDRYRDLVENSHELICTHDLDGNILSANPAGARMVGYEVNQLLTMNIRDFLVQPDGQEFDSYIAAIKQEEKASGLMQVQTRSGERRLWEYYNTLRVEGISSPVVRGMAHDITEREQTEAALKASERFARETLDALTANISILDQNGTIVAVNRSWREFAAANDIDPKRVSEGANYLEVCDAARGEQAEEAFSVAQGIRAVIRGELDTCSVEYPCHSPDQKRWFVAQVTKFKGEGPMRIVVAHEYVTERKLAEEKTQRHLARLKALREIDQAITSTFDMQTSLNVLLTQTLKLLTVDAATVLLLNHAANTLEYATGLGFRTKAHFHTSVRVGQNYAGKAVLERRLIEIANLNDQPDNPFGPGNLEEEEFVSYHSLPLIVKGQVLGVLEVFHRTLEQRDAEWIDFMMTLAGQAAVAVDNAQLFAGSQREISERKRAEEELRTLNSELESRVAERTNELRQANNELVRAVRVKDEFLANMSHELRTPLNAILGLSESLGEETAGALNDKQQKYVRIISESGYHLLSLINDILDLAKIEAGQIVLNRDKVDIKTVCEASLRMVRELAHKKHQELILEVDPSLDVILADERRLKQMLVNLLGNAVKFTPENGRIGLEVSRAPNENLILFTVWDTGIGIKEEDLARLFRPFVQLDSDLARESTGTGLGLALVAQMARLHGGSVSAASQAGVGSRFTISLLCESNLLTDTSSKVKITGKFHAAQPGGGEKQRTILLIEDTDDVIMILRDYLTYSGYTVITAKNGLDGIAKAGSSLPDLILMDVQMPGMDGLETTRRLRSQEEFAKTPIIALTALAMPNDRERCLAAGMNEYISKPVKLKALVNTIQTILT